MSIPTASDGKKWVLFSAIRTLYPLKTWQFCDAAENSGEFRSYDGYRNVPDKDQEAVFIAFNIMMREPSVTEATANLIARIVSEYISVSPSATMSCGLYARIISRWLRLSHTPLRSDDLPAFCEMPGTTGNRPGDVRWWQAVAAYLCRAEAPSKYLLPADEIDALAEHLATEFPRRLQEAKAPSGVRNILPQSYPNTELSRKVKENYLIPASLP